MIMFCGLPTSVATLPMLALVASAMRYGQHRQSPAPDHRDDKRGQHQANGVIDQQRRENSRRQREVKEQPLRRAREFQHRVGGPFEKMREVKIGEMIIIASNSTMVS